jgi:FAD/FMN-containing dehydrogenase
MAMSVQGTTQVTAAIEDSVFEALRESVRGEVLRPGDAGYDQARRVHNGMIDRRPAVIVRCAGVADVMTAVAFARDRNLLVAVRGGGHNVTGNAVCDGGIVIDLSAMKGIWLEQVTRTVRCEAGLTWGELNHDLQAFGLAAAGGYVSTTGVAGLTLGGGLGWLVRKHGLAADNLLGVDVVTADGRLVAASEGENADLFWAVRGGGGNFGVVTSFTFQVHPAGTVLAGLVLHPLDAAPDALRFWRDYARSSPEALTSGALLITAPPAPFVPPEAQGRPAVALGGVYTGDLDDAEAILEPLRRFGAPFADIFQPMPYSAAQVMADDLWPRGSQNYWKSGFLDALTDAAVDTIVERFAGVPSPLTTVVLEHNGDGAMTRVGPNETAFAQRRWPYNFLITSLWSDPADSKRNVGWTRDTWDALRPFLPDAVYVNYLGAEGEDRVRAAYGDDNYARLVAAKNAYDPTNMFRLNQNIAPSG